MTKITSETSMQEIAVLVSEALDNAGIPAVLSGGGAVSQYSDNEYMTTDLDFVSVASNKAIAPIVAELGFTPVGKDFRHPNSRFFVEFPAGPLSFGDRYVDSSETTTLDTRYGALRIITPSQCVMDRIAWLVHGKDPQSRDQAVMVAKHQQIDWDEIYAWAATEGISTRIVDGIRMEAAGNRL
jgi:hypothetical protein